MSKKILVLTGSPRKNGNSFAMTDAFIQAAEQNGHTVTRFDTAMMKISGCRACQTCYSTGKACTFDDDFNKIAPAILDADVIVFTMPVYWYSIPAQIKAVIDRIFSLVIGGKEIAGKECALITCCEEDDITVMDGIRIPLERSVELNKWTMIGEVLIPGVLNVGDIAKTDGCQQAIALANKL
ncbi:MAG: flavodoxin family protein [Oscillospiraceae bacterium]|nr:flavodoxin family protein [Oscillospiraceae bacterium]